MAALHGDINARLSLAEKAAERFEPARLRFEQNENINGLGAAWKFALRLHLLRG
jgi:hypothetical protein